MQNEPAETTSLLLFSLSFFLYPSPMSTASNITIKLFIGYTLTPDIYIQLNKSKEWKQAQIDPDASLISTIRYQEKQYIGGLTEEQSLPFSTVKEIGEQVQHALEKFCPELLIGKLKLYTFSQTYHG